MGSHEQAREQYTQCLETLGTLGRADSADDRVEDADVGAVGDLAFVIQVLAALGRQHQQLGEAAKAVETFRHALAVSKESVDAQAHAIRWNERADHFLAQGEVIAARLAKLAAIAAFETAGAQSVAVDMQMRLGRS